MAMRRRSSIRTASGSAQDRFLERVRALRDDPLRILPDCPGEAPRAIKKLRSRLERIHRKGPGFLDRRDKGIPGAVAHTFPLADLESVPRLMDRKVAGRRRFFLQRGHVHAGCLVGVQNHDDPLVLLEAYRLMAKNDGLHFFAGDRLWCTGSTPTPPDAWWDDLAGAAGLDLSESVDGDRGCGHADRVRLVFGLRRGPGLRVCSGCLEKAERLHGILAERYAGPRQRQPMELDVVLPDGTRVPAQSRDAAAVRAGVDPGHLLLERAVTAWRSDRGTSYVLGHKDFGDDQQAFLDALGAEGVERIAVEVMTRDGHVGPMGTVADVLAAHPDRLYDAVAAILGKDASEFLHKHKGQAAHDVIHEAAVAAARRDRLATLPLVRAGPVGTWVDHVVRAARGDDRTTAMNVVRDALGQRTIPNWHAWAFLEALGGDLTLQARFSTDDRQAGDPWKDAAARILEAEGDAYVTALRDYLDGTGTGEQVQTL